MAFEQRIAALETRRSGLDDDIQSELKRPIPDEVLIAEIKKKKLALKEEIRRLKH